MTSIRHLAVLACASILAGCAAPAAHGDQQFGDAARQAMLRQILNPAAPAHLSVAGMDGQAAKSAHEAYQKSFREPQPQSGALTVGVGK